MSRRTDEPITYTMSAERARLWKQGDRAQFEVEEAILEHLIERNVNALVLVALPGGRVVFSIAKRGNA